MTKRTEIWSQMHKTPLKSHIEAPKIKKKLGGDPLNPPVERGINPPSRVFGTRCNLIARWAQDAGVSNRLKKVIQIDVLLTLYELIEFCLLVIYNKPGVVQYIYIAGHRLLLKKSCISFSEHHICINKQ